MKFVILSLALLGAVAADVKHLNLNNMYLPPHAPKLGHQRVEYVQQNQEIPQLSQSYGGPVEITDNSVTSQVESQEQAGEQQYFTGKINIDNLNYGPGYAGEIHSHTDEKKYYTGAISVAHPEIPTGEIENEEKKYYTGLDYKPGQDDSGTTSTTTTTINAENSVPAPGSDTFTQQQATYYTQQSQNQETEQKYYTGLIAPTQGETSASIATTTDSHDEQVSEEPEKKYYTGLIAPTQGDSSATTSTTTINHVEQVSQEPERQYYTGLIAPTQGDSSASISTSTFSHVEHVSQEPERQYYTGLIAPTQGDSSASISTSSINHVEHVSQEPERQYYTGLIAPTHESTVSHTTTTFNAAASIPAPGSDDFTRQQAAYWTQQLQNQEAEKKYYSGLVYRPGQESVPSTATIEEQQSVSVAAPGSDAFTQQQAAYYSSVSQQHEAAAPALGATSGIDTQYAADGGYVY